MKRIFLDTNVFVRVLTRDDEGKFKDCLKIFKQIKEGKVKPYTSNVVILEIVFVLLKLYKFSKIKVFSAIRSLLQIRNLVLVEKTDSKKALLLFKKLNIKYSDCLISTQLSRGVVLVTYDRDFSKISNLPILDPSQI